MIESKIESIDPGSISELAKSIDANFQWSGIYRCSRDHRGENVGSRWIGHTNRTGLPY